MLTKEQDFRIFWFRRDLRWEDNHALYLALKDGVPVVPIFIFDTDILNQLEDRHDRRVNMIHQVLKLLNEKLQQENHIHIYHGSPEEVFTQLIKEYPHLTEVYANEDYEPQAIKRDTQIHHFLQSHGKKLVLVKDQVIFHKNEITKADGKPYTVYTPYSKAWLKKFSKNLLPNYPSEDFLHNLTSLQITKLPSLEDLGFLPTDFVYTPPVFSEEKIRQYDEVRNLPALDATSRLSHHLRFGTISIRKLIRETRELNATYLKELIWREFFMQILWHFPYVSHSEFRPKYTGFPWNESEEDFQKWCSGNTGFPLVDAGMRELMATGFMHNRVRMLTASFLIKHLLIDWRKGEAWFAQKLLDFDLAQNNGNWQWVAGTGVDAAPYYRVFNPHLQLEKFDADKMYVKKWIPEYGTPKYPKEICSHELSRGRYLALMKEYAEPKV